MINHLALVYKVLAPDVEEPAPLIQRFAVVTCLKRSIQTGCYEEYQGLRNQVLAAWSETRSQKEPAEVQQSGVWEPPAGIRDQLLRQALRVPAHTGAWH